MEATLNYDGARYHYQRRTRSTGLAALVKSYAITEESQGVWCGTYPEPSHYRYAKREGSKLKAESLDFRGTQVTGVYKEQPVSLKVPQGIQDFASLELALMAAAAGTDKPKQFALAYHGKLSTKPVRWEGAATVQTPQGQQPAVALQLPHESKKRETKYWLAAGLHHLPALLEHQDKEGRFRFVLRSVEFGNRKTQDCKS